MNVLEIFYGEHYISVTRANGVRLYRRTKSRFIRLVSMTQPELAKYLSL